jgi:hypothetical protein
MANYKILRDCPSFLLIQDVGPWDSHKSITNDAESVVAELAPGLGDRKLFYVDSEGDTDRLLVVDGKFAGFKSEQPSDVNSKFFR